MTEDAWIQLIIASIGGDTESGLLATYLPIYWQSHADIADDATRAAATKIDGIQLLLGNAWAKVSFRALDGASVDLSDMYEHLKDLLGMAQNDLALLEGSSTVGAGASVGLLSKTAPVMPGRCWPDPNDRAYKGDPLRRTRIKPW